MRRIKRVLLYLTWFSLGYSVAQGAEIFGGYSNGCIRGAVELDESGNFQIQRWGQNRSFAHPELIDYLKRLIARAQEYQLPPLLIGDLSKPYGGPFGDNSSHKSHNIGLDADISFDFASPKKSSYELSHPKDVYLVDSKGEPTVAFTRERAALIYLAADDPRVQRIFVAPGIKRTLCQWYSQEGYSTAWLHKVRPWFGHRGHMHVRLYCPEDSLYCEAQKEAPIGDGCGAELASWFEPPQAGNGKNKSTPKKKKELPAQCQAVLKGR